MCVCVWMIDSVKSVPWFTPCTIVKIGPASQEVEGGGLHSLLQLPMILLSERGSD